jgi:Rha family phage regulatory protein
MKMTKIFLSSGSIKLTYKGWNVVKQLVSSNIKMTSLDVAEIVGKQHQHVMRDIRGEIENLGTEIGESIFGLTSYKDKSNRESPCYTFGKDGAMQLALKYDAKTRYLVIKRIEELETADRGLPTTYKDALIQLVARVEENEALQLKNLMLTQQNKELKPSADYTDSILRNKGLVNIGQIAKDYGLSAQKMNELLHELGIQYKQGKQWLLYSKYHAKGYTHSETINIKRSDGSADVTMNTKWTQKGRLFIYDLLKQHGTLPMIERNA